jgi:hypothetical protein
MKEGSKEGEGNARKKIEMQERRQEDGGCKKESLEGRCGKIEMQERRQEDGGR